jgi:hypothetical protein
MKVEPTIRVSGLNITLEILLQNKPAGIMNAPIIMLIAMMQIFIPISINIFTGKSAFVNHNDVVAYSTGVFVQFVVYMFNMILFNIINIMSYMKMVNMETLYTMINCYSRGYYQVKSEMPQIAMFDA